MLDDPGPDDNSRKIIQISTQKNGSRTFHAAEKFSFRP
jgi:hypothetical protein